MVWLLLYTLLIMLSTLSAGGAAWALVAGGGEAERPPHPALLMCIGLACQTTLAAWLCIWMPMAGLAGWAAALGPIGFLTLSACRAAIRQSWASLPPRPWASLAATLLFVLVGLIKAAGPTELLDDGIGYVPLLRAMLDAGTVIGLGNLQPNWAYNSHINIAAAMYGGLPWWPTLMFDTNLWMTGVGAWYFFSPLDRLRPSNGNSSEIGAVDIVSIILPFFFFRNQMSACSTDLPLCILVWLVAIEWIRTPALAGGAGRALLVFGLLPLFIPTVKLTGLAIIWVYIFLMLAYWAKGPGPSRWVAGMVAVAALVLTPWLVRNVMMTGYLYLLAPGIDVFDYDWKIPSSVLARLQDQVAGNVHHSPKHWTSWAWLQTWWRDGFVPSGRAIVGLAALSLPILAYGFAKGWAHISRRTALASLMVFTGLMLWLGSATEERYGHAWICLAALSAPALLLVMEYKSRPALIGGAIVGCVLGTSLMVLVRTLRDDGDHLSKILIAPAPYPTVNTAKGTGPGGFTYYLPTAYRESVSDGFIFYQGKGTGSYTATVHCWACPLPCIYHKSDLPYLRARGTILRDGFRFAVPPPKEILDGRGLPVDMPKK